MNVAERTLLTLDQQITAKNVLQHPFYQAWAQGTLSLEALQDYATQYYHHVAAFPTYLSAVHSNTTDTAARRVLLQNLMDEEAGSPNHPELWLQFAEGLGVSRETVLNTPALAATTTTIETFQNLCRKGSLAEGVAALYAYESQIPEVAQSKIAGLQTHYQITDPNTLHYFAIHIEADEVHRAEERALLSRCITEETQATATLEAADRALDAIWNLLSSVCHRHAIACH